MRISDWSSDVCSSDLVSCGAERRFRLQRSSCLAVPSPHRHLDAAVARLGHLVGGRHHGVGLAVGGDLQQGRLDAFRDEDVADRLGALQPEGGVQLLRPDAVRSEEHTSELPSLMRISYAVFCLKKKTKTTE